MASAIAGGERILVHGDETTWGDFELTIEWMPVGDRTVRVTKNGDNI